MATSSPIPDPLRGESQEPQPQAPDVPMDPPLAPAVTPQKQERDYLVIGLIIALMAMIVAGFFALDSKIDALETTVNGRIDALIIRIDALEITMNGRIDALSTRIDALSTRIDGLETSLNARIDGLYELVLSLKTSIGQ